MRPIEPTQTYFPEPTDEAIAHAARLLAGSSRPLVLAGNGVLRQNAAQALRDLANGLHLPVAVDVHGQGRDRRPQPPVAHGGRPPGPRSRADRLRSVGPRRVRRLRPGRVRPVAMEPRRPQADHPHRHAAGRGRRVLPARGRARRRHRRDAPPAARRHPAARHRRPRRQRAARDARDARPRRTCARRCSRSSGAATTTTAGRSSRRRRSPTCAARSARRTSW